MPIVSLQPRASFIGDPSVNAFHATMFHGLLERDGKRYPHDPIVWANTPNPSPLELSRTRDIPDIFCPGLNLVVSDKIRAAVPACDSCRIVYLPVVFRKLVDLEWTKGEVDSRWQRLDDFETIIDRSPDVPALHRGVSAYSEMLVWRLSDVVAHNSEARPIKINIGAEGWPEVVTLSMSQHLIDTYGIVYGDSNLIIRPDIFDKIDRFIDRDFFIVREYDCS